MMQVAALIGVSILVTGLVYGLVLLIVRADEVGQWLQPKPYVGVVGYGIVGFMPYFLNFLSILGIIFMASIGSHLCVECLNNLGFDMLYKTMKSIKSHFDSYPYFFVDLAVNVPFGIFLGVMVFAKKKIYSLFCEILVHCVFLKIFYYK